MPEIEEYLTQLHFSMPKVPKLPEEIAREYGPKTDIIFKVRNMDRSVGSYGYSIKSHLGGNPTLFNCSKSSNLLFEVHGCNDKKMAEINIKCNENNQAPFLYMRDDKELDLRFIRTTEQFEANLESVGDLPRVFAYLMLVRIGYFGNRCRMTRVLVEKLSEKKSFEL